MAVTINGLRLPDQTLFTGEHSAGTGATDVAHTLSGKAVIFSKRLKSRAVQLVFNDELAWLNQSQHDALIALANMQQVLSLSVRGVDYNAIMNFSAADGSVVLTPVMPFCDRYSGVINLILLES
jgi:hypothetical protein